MTAQTQRPKSLVALENMSGRVYFHVGGCELVQVRAVLAVQGARAGEHGGCLQTFKTNICPANSDG